MSAKICKCGNETNEPDGVCVVCKFDMRLGRLNPSVNTQDGHVETNDVIPAEAGIQEAKGLDARLRISGMTNKKAGAGLSVRPVGGERMKERDYKGHQKCRKEGCIKYGVKDGLCYRHFKEEHGHAPFASSYKRKKAKVLPTPEIKVKNNTPRTPYPTPSEKIDAYREEREKTISIKSSDEILKLVAQITAKRDALKFEIVKLDGALLTLHDLAGVDIPAPEFLNAG
jgi:hypothetical protein